MIQILLILLVAFSSVLGCATANLTKGQIREDLIKTLNNIDSYCYKMQMYMETSISGEDGKDIVKSSENAYVDVKNKRVKVLINMNEINKARSKLTKAEIYIFDTMEYLHLCSDGKWDNWVKFEVSRDKFESENQVKKQIKLAVLSKIKSLKGKGNYYLLNIEPENETFWKLVMEQEEEHPLLKLLNLDYEDVIKEADMNIWIEKGILFPIRSVLKMKAIIEGEIMKEPFRMTINVEKVYKYYDYNKSVALELPEEAKKARVYEEEWD